MTPLVEQLFIKAKRKGLTAVKWAELSKIDRKTLYSIKYQNKNTSLTTIEKMGAGLGLKLTWVQE